MRIKVENGTETVVFRSVDETVDSEIEVDTAEFCLYKTIETKLDQRAFKVLQGKIENQKYRLILQGMQIVVVLEVENPKNQKKELRKCVEYIDAVIDQIRIDTHIDRQIRHKACVIGNLIEAELRVQMF